MTPAERIGLASLIVGALGTIAGWLALPYWHADTNSTTGVHKPPASDRPLPAVPQTSTRVVEHDGFLFVARYCETSFEKDSVTCYLTVTNLGRKPRAARLDCWAHTQSKLVDIEGDVHHTERCGLAGDSGRGYAADTLSPNVEYQIYLRFRAWRVPGDHIQYLELQWVDIPAPFIPSTRSALGFWKLPLD